MPLSKEKDFILLIKSQLTSNYWRQVSFQLACLTTMKKIMEKKMMQLLFKALTQLFTSTNEESNQLKFKTIEKPQSLLLVNAKAEEKEKKKTSLLSDTVMELCKSETTIRFLSIIQATLLLIPLFVKETQFSMLTRKTTSSKFRLTIFSTLELKVQD